MPIRMSIGGQVPSITNKPSGVSINAGQTAIATVDKSQVTATLKIPNRLPRFIIPRIPLQVIPQLKYPDSGEVVVQGNVPGRDGSGLMVTAINPGVLAVKAQPQWNQLRLDYLLKNTSFMAYLGLGIFGALAYWYWFMGGSKARSE